MTDRYQIELGQPVEFASQMTGETRYSGTILDIAGPLDIPVAERALGRTELYLADEAFYCGTGQEIMPIVAFDGRPVGEGVPGLVTRRLQAAFDDIVRGRNDAYQNWLTPVYHG